MDPLNPVPPPARYPVSITTVQRWVLTVLMLTTMEHFAAGLVLAGMFSDPVHPDARIGLNVLAGVVATLSIAGALLIHGRRVLSPWLLLGPVPTVIGLWLTFR